MIKSVIHKLSLVTLSMVLTGTALLVSHVDSTVQAAPSEKYMWKNVVTGGGGGFVPGIVFNPTEKNLIYARTDIGGAYRWEESSQSWIPLTDAVGWDDWNKNGVDALATDPIDPNRVYLATGTYTNEWDPNNGHIMRSTNKGKTWETTDLPFKVGGNMPGRSMGERLVIDPNNNQILYFGARSGNGLWKSIDYGKTWAQVKSFPNVGNYVQDPSNSYTSDIIGLAWITFDSRTGSKGETTQTIYVGVADKQESIYRSIDGGATWQPVAGQPKGYLPHHGVLSSTGQLYISYSDGAGPYDGKKGDVWKFDTNTGQWSNISPIPSTSADNTSGYGGLAVDTNHPDTLVVATMNRWWPDEIIYRSTDRGATWSPIWEYSEYPKRTERYTQDISAAPWLNFSVVNAHLPEVSPKLGWMIGSLEIDPFNSDRMMYGTGATIYGTQNLTDWDKDKKVNISVMAKGIEETAVLDLISPPEGAPLISALGDISGFRHNNWTKVPENMFLIPTFSTTTSLDYAEFKPSFVVRVGTNGENQNKVAVSGNGGSTWNAYVTNPDGTAGGGTIAIANNTSSLVWGTSDKGVYYSTDIGRNWTKSIGIPKGAKVEADRMNPHLFYATVGGKFYVSRNGGAYFTVTQASGLPGANSEDSVNFKAMTGIEGDIWLAGGSEASGMYGLWHSTDQGNSFTRLSNVEQADVIGFGKAAPGKKYMALYVVAKIDGVRGVFRSDDAGVSWIRINDDQHQYARINMTITGDPRAYGRVYLGTNGRGILVANPISRSNLIDPENTLDAETVIEDTYSSVE